MLLSVSSVYAVTLFARLHLPAKYEFCWLVWRNFKLMEMYIMVCNSKPCSFSFPNVNEKISFYTLNFFLKGDNLYCCSINLLTLKSHWTIFYYQIDAVRLYFQRFQRLGLHLMLGLYRFLCRHWCYF